MVLLHFSPNGFGTVGGGGANRRGAGILSIEAGLVPDWPFPEFFKGFWGFVPSLREAGGRSGVRFLEAEFWLLTVREARTI